MILESKKIRKHGSLIYLSYSAELSSQEYFALRLGRVGKLDGFSEKKKKKNLGIVWSHVFLYLYIALIALFYPANFTQSNKVHEK